MNMRAPGPPTALRALFLLAAAAGVLWCLLAPAPALAAFPDVPDDYRYAEAVNQLAKQKVIEGFGDGTFGPYQVVTRQQFAKMIVLAMSYTVGESDVCAFPDVDVSGPGDLYPDNYVAVAAAHKITLGITPTSFAPFANISRAQVITMVLRAVKDYWTGPLPSPPSDWQPSWPTSFDSVHGPNAALAEYDGLLRGLPLDSLDPWGVMPRGEVAQVLSNVLHLRAGGIGTQLLHYWWTPVQGWDAEDVTLMTGQLVVHYNLASYRTPPGTSWAEHIAAVTPAGDLAVFWEIPGGHNWALVNVSQIVPYRVDSPVVAWERGLYPTQVDNIAGITFDGHLVVFSWSSAGGWIATDVTQHTGQEVAKRVTPVFWLTGSGVGSSEHLAAAAPDGDVLVFSRTPPGAWTVTNVTSVDHQRVDLDTGFAAWQTPLGSELVEHLAAPNEAGDLIVHWWRAAYGWKAVNISGLTGYQVAGAPTAWQTPTLPTYVEHLAATSTSDDLIVFWYTPANDWKSINVSQKTGKKTRPALESWTTYIGTSTHAVDHVAVPGEYGGILVFYADQDANNWMVVDVSAATSTSAEGPVTSWRTGEAPDVVEHMAAFGPD
jgi:hypothetical protein